MRLFKQGLVGMLFAFAFCVAPSAQASTLTSQQVSAIVTLLQAFGADATTINNVTTSLTGQSVVQTEVTSCDSFGALRFGDKDSLTRGQVSKLQRFLGITPTSGYYGVLTKTAFGNKCVHSNAQPTTIVGMSKYTDTDFGFSFWYPSGWTVTPYSNSAVNQYPNGSYDGAISIRSNANPSHLLTIQKVTANDFTYRVRPGACGTCGPVNYFFDTSKHLWMKFYPDGPNGAPDASAELLAQYKDPKPADVSQNTMGGLHMFSTEQRESAVIIPLSAKHFLLVTDNTYTEMCGSSCASPDIKGGASYLANTIVATDPSVATPTETAKQITTIQAAAGAYGN